MIAGNNKELKMLAKAADEFARKQLAPERENNDKYPFGPLFESVMKKAFDLDFFHVTLPEDMKGMGLGIRALSVLLEAVSQSDSSLGAMIFTNAFAQELCRVAGETAVLKEVLGRAEGLHEFLLAYPVFTNPSEFESTIMAEKHQHAFRLQGTQQYLTLGNIAAQALVPANIKGTSGYSLILVKLNNGGIEMHEPVLSLGTHACPSIDVRFNNAEGILIGEAGKGAAYFSAATDRLAPAAAAISGGIMKGAFKDAFQYSKERFQGGRQIINWSEVQMMLADMSVISQTGEMLVAQSSAAVDDRMKGWESFSQAAAIQVLEMACEQTCNGVQVLGGAGYMKDYGQEKRFRDAQQIQALLGIAPMKKIQYIRRFM